MKLQLLLLSFLFSSFFNVLLAEPPAYIQTRDGVIVFTDPAFTGTSHAVKLEVVSDNIIRVIAAAGKDILNAQSLVTVYTKRTDLSWKLISSGDKLNLKTSALTATIHLKTGAVSFFDAKGKKIIYEKPIAGRSFQSAVFDGKRYYNLTQTFQTSSDEAWYGLGQHQDGVLNYRGQQVSFFQNNTEVAIPFLVSSKNYGILWDNYSLTKVGDVRPLHPLSSLQLFSKKDEAGWLTASYANDKQKPADIITQRSETSISMEFLGESKTKLPKEFTPENGMVTWEGRIASHLSGLHQLRFVFGGSLKVWLNGKLVLDHWRKAWNPAPALIPFHFKKGEKTTIKIEWTPEGGESYISLKWQEPLNDEELNSFSFSSEAGQQVDYYFIYGNNMDEVISGFSNFAGTTNPPISIVQ